MLKHIMRGLAAVALFCWAVGASAQTSQITVLHVFHPSALAWLATQSSPNPATPDQYVAANQNFANNVFLTQGVTAEFAQPLSPSYHSTTQNDYPGDSRFASRVALDLNTAVLRDKTGSVIVVAVTDLGAGALDEPPAGGTIAFSDGRWQFSPIATVVVNVRDGPATWMHEVLDGIMGTQRQRQPGDGLVDPPYNHGWIYATGYDTSNCMIHADITADIVHIDRSVSVTTCSGWTAGWLTPSTTKICDAQLWCDGNGQYSAASYGVKWDRSELTAATPPNYYDCKPLGHYPGTGSFVYYNLTTLPAPSPGSPGIISCPNTTRGNYISQNTSIGGFHIGGPYDDNVAYLNSSISTFLNLAGRQRGPAVHELRCFIGLDKGQTC